MSMIGHNSAPFILALDISKTCTGICEGRAGETPRLYSIRGEGVDVVKAMVRLGDWLIKRSQVDHIDWLYFEAPIHPGAFLGEYDEDEKKVKAKSNPNVAITLAKMVGVIEFVAEMSDIKTRSANVQTVRKAFLGNARPDDPKQRARAMCRALNWPVENLDQADAAAVWYYACTQAAPRHYQPITPMLQAKVASQFDHRGSVPMELAR